MTSQINPNNINGNYPVAGIPNNTQGMRDNFTETRTNFQYAADEITELQNKVVLKQALTGGTLDNDLNDNVLRRAVLQDIAYTLVNIPATSGTITLDYSAGSYQQINPTGPCTLAFANFPPAGQVGDIFFGFNVTNVNQTLTLPAAVSQGLFGLEGISPGTAGVTNTITFGRVGNFTFELFTPDGGVTFYIVDLGRPRDKFFSPIEIANVTPATSTATGALIVDGGVGVGGNLYVGGDIVGNITVTGVSVVGNVIGGNIVTAGLASVVGNVIGGNIVTANGIYGTTLTVNTIGSDDSTEVKFITDVTFDDEVSVNGNLTVTGDVNMAGVLATGNVVGSNITTAGLISATGNMVGSNITTAGLISATGNVVGNNLSVINALTVGTVISASSIDTQVLTTNRIRSDDSTFVEIEDGARIEGSVETTGSILSSGTAGVGYTTGAGGTVTQEDSKSDPVTLNTISGEITMDSAQISGDATVAFTLNNSVVANTDVMILNQVGGGNVGFYSFNAICAAGSANIAVHNMTNTNRSDAIVIRFAVIKAAVA
jgi:hypothetical protein